MIVLVTQYCSGDQIKKNEMDWTCSTYGGEVMCIQGLVWKPEQKRPLGRCRLRWEVDLQEVGWGGGGHELD